jgi:RNA polymerase sigma-70 factor (ECF subfamily)
VDLLVRARAGDQSAVAEVFARAIPPLRRWARGRLPVWARDIVDTDDLVQDTVICTLRRIEVLDCRHDGALHAYLRQALLNRIRNEIRRAKRHPAPDPIDSGVAASEQSPLEALVGRQTLDAYDDALMRLDPRDREAVVGRIELGLSYEDLAAVQNRASANAARMAVARALVKLARLANL